MRPDVWRLARNSVIFVVIIWIGAFILLLLPKDERGVFGDMFGSVNALFSGLGLAGIILTLYLQQKDSSRQKFETTFFNLLTFYRDAIDHIIPNDRTSEKGEQFFQNFMNKLQTAYNTSQYPDERNKISSSIILLMVEEVGVVTNWLEKIYRILSYIDRYCPTEKLLYFEIFHSRLSNHETALLFYLVYALPPDDNDPSLRDLLISSRFFQITNVHVFLDLSHSDILAPSFE